MRAKVFLTTFLSFYFYLLSSQVPQGFNYQAIARDNSGNPIVNQALQVKLAVTADSLGATIYWEELFGAVTTNSYGLFTVTLGQGARQGTSTVPFFSSINWNNWPLFVRTQIYYQGGWKMMGSSRLWSVPYTLLSNNAISASGLSGNVPHIGVAGNSALMDSALFVVRNTTGQIVFAVYNEGVRIYVDDGAAKGTAKGGFAIGGFGTSKNPSQPLFVVGTDSIRGYIGTNPGKGVKGGFAIGGFSTNKAPGEEYLRITRDSSRVYVADAAKGTKGGFAIGGFSRNKGTISNFMNMTPDNYFIGEASGTKTTSGLYNSFFGYQSGASNTSGSNNVFIGYQSGNSNLDGSKNAFIGYLAGYSNTSGYNNVFLGDSSGFFNTTGKDNIFIGNLSGISNSSGFNNVYLGFESGNANQTGAFNVGIGNQAGKYNTASGNLFLGQSAGWHNTSGQLNAFMGAAAGRDNTTGSFNTYVGSLAGLSATGSSNTFIGFMAGELNTGSGNVFIGYGTGASETGSNKLYIANSPTSKPLIWGDFSTPALKLNGTVRLDDNYLYLRENYSNEGLVWGYSWLSIDGPVLFGWAGGALATSNGTVALGWNSSGNVGIGTTSPGTYKLYVNGAAYSTGGWSGSDIRWKKNIQPLTIPLEKIMQLQGVTYEWRTNEFPKTEFDKGIQLGLIAQDVEKILPELVKTDENGYKAVTYEKLTVVLLEGIKELRKTVEAQDTRIKSLENLVVQLTAKNGVK